MTTREGRIVDRQMVKTVWVSAWSPLAEEEVDDVDTTT